MAETARSSLDYLVSLTVSVEKGGGKPYRVQLSATNKGAAAEFVEESFETLPLALGYAGQLLFNLRTSGRARLQAGELRRRRDG